MVSTAATRVGTSLKLVYQVTEHHTPVLSALHRAVQHRQLGVWCARHLIEQVVHHSDRGVQYACGDYAEKLEAAGIIRSMSRPGCPYDNAKAESFMKTLKKEDVNGADYRDISHARDCIGVFLEEVYNRQRLHSALKYRPPEEFENDRPWAAAQQPMGDNPKPLSPN